MTEWFSERYISRDDHQRIVDYYKKLVGKLHCQVRALQSQAEAEAQDAKMNPSQPDLRQQRIGRHPPHVREGNVIHVDFRKCGRDHA